MFRYREATAEESAASEAGDHPVDVTDEEMFTVLSNSRRLSVLRQLLETDEPMDLGTLVEAVAVEEFCVTPADLDRKQERRVYVALHQNHLPYLEEKGLVEWDRSRGVIALREAAPLDRFLGTSPDHPPDSYRSPLVLSVCSLGLVTGYLAEAVDPLPNTPLAPLSLVTAALLLAAAVTWTVEQRP